MFYKILEQFVLQEMTNILNSIQKTWSW